MSIYTPTELEALEEDLAYWVRLEHFVPGWKCFGWTYRNSAIYDTGNGTTLTLNGRQRDDLIEALSPVI